MTELKPSEKRKLVEMELRKSMEHCPHCNGRPYLETSSRAWEKDEKTEKEHSFRVSFVRCMNCGARGGMVKVSDYGKTSRSIEAEKKAVELWNRRVKNV